MKAIFCGIASLLCALTGVVSVTPQEDEIRFGSSYNGSIYAGSKTEYVTYVTKEEEESFINGGLPRYYDTSGRSKTCANVAGTILLGYYDKNYDELIPDFTSARVIRDRVIYYAQTSAVQDVIDELYYDMDTNTATGGTTIKDFQNGLRKYVNELGRNIAFSNVGNSNGFNYSAYLNSIRNEQPVALFVSKYSLIPIADFGISATQDRLEKDYYTGNHVLVGYGLKEIKYYNSKGTLQKTITLLMVATGYSREPLYYVDLSDCGYIDSYSVNIY